MIRRIEIPNYRAWWDFASSDPIRDLRKLRSSYKFNCIIVPRAAHSDLAMHPLLRSGVERLSNVNGGNMKKAFKEFFEHYAAIDNYIVGDCDNVTLLYGDDIVAEIIFEGE